LFNPFLLFITEKVRFAEDLLFLVKCHDYSTSEKVHDKEVTKDNENDEEEGPVQAVLSLWLHVNTD
jgi:hypothetical protein